MPNVRFNLLYPDNSPFTGSVTLYPRAVEVSGSQIYTLDWVENSTDFLFSNVGPGLYEATASSAQIVTPLFALLVPTGSQDWNAQDLAFPPMSDGSLRWVPQFAVSSSWASSSLSASYVQGANVRGNVLTASYALRAGDSDTLGGFQSEDFFNASHLASGTVPGGRLTGSYVITASMALSASYAVTASNLHGFAYDTASLYLDVSQSWLVVMERMTESFSQAEFSYVGISGSSLSRGKIQAGWIPGQDSSSFTWTNYGADDVGNVDLQMSAVLDESSVQLQAYSPASTGWTVKAWAIYI